MCEYLHMDEGFVTDKKQIYNTIQRNSIPSAKLFVPLEKLSMKNNL